MAAGSMYSDRAVNILCCRELTLWDYDRCIHSNAGLSIIEMKPIQLANR
jgi:hypothetical protein